jgi:hypothetical protein
MAEPYTGHTHSCWRRCRRESDALAVLQLVILVPGGTAVIINLICLPKSIYRVA